MIKYELAEDIQRRINTIIDNTNLWHIKKDNVVCVRSHGSESRGIIARCHALTRIWQKALNTKAIYIVEVISERFDKFSEEEKTKTLIHELMHIPKAFGGGFKHHDFVTSRNVDKIYKLMIENEKNKNPSFWN